MYRKKTNILLVEDEESHAELISQSFESITERVRVTVTHNIHEARTSIAKSTPDLIIADYFLPDGKGIELITANREEPPYPIVIMTSHGDKEVAAEAMKAGAFDYLVKSAAMLDDMPHICERILREWQHITERKQAETALQEYEEKYRKLVATAQDTIPCDIHGVITDRDKSAEKLIGYSKKGDTPNESSEPEQNTRSKNLYTLVVDDEEEICTILDKFFSKGGHRVKTVDNGVDAIELAKNEYFDLVLCDLAMPTIYGFDVVKFLNKLKKRPKIGIITGWNEKIMPLNCEDLKVDFIMRKPFDFPKLTRHINDIIDT